MKLLFFLLISMSIQAGQPMVAVFCSADDNASDQFKILAHNLGKQLAGSHYGLITGGSRTGLMKEVTDGYVATAKDLKNLYGALPQVLASYNVQHTAIPTQNLLWTETLHTRLDIFNQRADIIIILPGGFGTLHELLDFLVINQFTPNKKPIIIINPDGYWDHLLQQFETMIKHKLLSKHHAAALITVSSERECLRLLTTENFVTVEHGLETHYWERSEK